MGDSLQLTLLLKFSISIKWNHINNPRFKLKLDLGHFYSICLAFLLSSTFKRTLVDSTLIRVIRHIMITRTTSKIPIGEIPNASTTIGMLIRIRIKIISHSAEINYNIKIMK